VKPILSLIYFIYAESKKPKVQRNADNTEKTKTKDQKKEEG
jgi:hypothetical protein